MDATPVLARTDDPVDRVIEKIQQLAAVRPALLRLLEWQIDQELEQTQGARPSARSFLILIPDGDDQCSARGSKRPALVRLIDWQIDEALDDVKYYSAYDDVHREAVRDLIGDVVQ